MAYPFLSPFVGSSILSQNPSILMLYLHHCAYPQFFLQHCSNSPDAELPSVMTCANYLKLPHYSSKVTFLDLFIWTVHGKSHFFHLYIIKSVSVPKRQSIYISVHPIESESYPQVLSEFIENEHHRPMLFLE